MPGRSDPAAIDPGAERRLDEQTSKHEAQVGRAPPRRQPAFLADVAEAVAGVIDGRHHEAARHQPLGQPGEVRRVAAASMGEEHDRKGTRGRFDRRFPGGTAGEDAVPPDGLFLGPGRGRVPDGRVELPASPRIVVLPGCHADRRTRRRRVLDGARMGRPGWLIAGQRQEAPTARRDGQQDRNQEPADRRADHARHATATDHVDNARTPTARNTHPRSGLVSRGAFGS